MLTKKKWHVLSDFIVDSSQFTTEKLVAVLLENRGIKSKEDRENFLHPKLEDVTVGAVGIDKKQLTKAIKRIQKAIDTKEQIVVFGDYDVDGITATAIVWETLYALQATVIPYIPDRIEEGYGLSIEGIKNITSFNLAQTTLGKQISPARNASSSSSSVVGGNISLIITVDNGIVAHDAVEFANQQGIDVIITDHHARSNKDPDAYAIVHTTKLCGAGVAWLISQATRNNVIARNEDTSDVAIPSQVTQIANNEIASPFDTLRVRNDKMKHLDLVALATVADLVPLTGANRILVKFGLENLRNTKRIGLHALFSEAGIEQAKIGVYEIGHIIGPRLNAMGRMASAMDSLRLLCTKDPGRAIRLAETLGRTNRERQLLTQEMTSHAIEKVKSSTLTNVSVDKEASKIKNILFVYDEAYEQGVIGLVASKLVETYYRPAIVLSKGEKHSKASARSISGFNIIEFIRSHEEFLVNAGGHPMAAGFTVETHRLEELQSAMEELSLTYLTEEILTRSLKIDCELPIEVVNQQLYDTIQHLAPFGMGNPEPIFVSRDVVVEDVRAIGAQKNHLRLTLISKSHLFEPERFRLSAHRRSPQSRWPNPLLKGEGKDKVFEAIAFGFGEFFDNIKSGDRIDIAYVVDENEWRGNKKLQLKIKDIQIKNSE